MFQSLYFDSLAAIFIGSNLTFDESKYHIEVNFHYIHDKVNKSFITMRISAGLHMTTLCGKLDRLHIHAPVSATCDWIYLGQV